MITSIVLALAVQTSNPVNELIDFGSKYVTVQAVVKLPVLSAHERAAAQIMAETMSDQTEGFSRGDLRSIAARAGKSLKITLMPDHLRIQFGVLPADTKTAISYVDQILRSSLFPDEAITNAEAELPFRKTSLWAEAIQPAKLDFSKIKREEVVELYHRICRPENVWLSVGGPIEVGMADSFWQSKNQDWIPAKLPHQFPEREPVDEFKTVPGRESMIELRGKEIAGNDPAISVQILAVIALGSGKGSAMFSRLRETEGWSYRQESIFWPTTNGFVPRLIMASGDKTPPNELAKAMKLQLIDAVNAWTDADVARARGMAEGILLRGVPMSPLYFNPSWPVLDNLEDQTFMHSYWRMKTGTDWEPRRLVGEMALVTLPDLKDAALGILSVSIPHVMQAEK